MTKLLQTGQLGPVATIAQRITGKRPSRPTIWRWLRAGVSGGITLEAVPAGRSWHTTEAAFRDFLARRAEAMLAPRATVPAADDAALRAVGLL